MQSFSGVFRTGECDNIKCTVAVKNAKWSNWVTGECIINNPTNDKCSPTPPRVCSSTDKCGTGSYKETRTCEGDECPDQAENMDLYTKEYECNTLECGEVTKTETDFPCQIFRIDCRDTLTMSIVCKFQKYGLYYISYIKCNF